MKRNIKSGLAIVIAVGFIGIFNACKQNKPENESSQSAVTEDTTQTQMNQDTIKERFLKVIELSGTPYERGLTHGKTLKKEINALLAKRKESLSKVTGMSADDFIRKFLDKTNFIPAIKKSTPSLLDEIRGIADGAGIDFNTMFFYQLGDELWANMNDVLAVDQCSSLGADKTADHPAFAAQNMDVPSLFDGYQTLLHIKYPDSDLEAYVFTFAGNIALNGMNNKSIGICANTLSQLDYSNDGLPVACVIRKVLEQTQYEDAVTFVKTVKHASGQNYIVGGPEKAVSLECSSNKVTPFVPYPDADRTFHTNHPLANDDKSKFLERLKKSGKEEDTTGDSYIRFEAVNKRLSDNTKKIDIAYIKSVLRSRDSEQSPVCKLPIPGRSFTFGSTIMVLSETPELIIAPGPPHITPFQTFGFTK